MKRRYLIPLTLVLALLAGFSLAPSELRAENEDLEGVWYTAGDTDRRWDFVVIAIGNAMEILIMADRAETDRGGSYARVEGHWLLRVDGAYLSGYYYLTPRCPNLRYPASGTISADRTRIELSKRSFVGSMNPWHCTIGGWQDEDEYRVLIRR